jgi:Zn-finger nucleic acid-binding protein
MDSRCPYCRTQFHRLGSGQPILHCASCSVVWLDHDTLRHFVRDAVNAAGVPRKVVALMEAPGPAADLACPACAAGMLAFQLRGVAVLWCSTCDCVLTSQAELREIVRRAVEAAGGWRAAEAEWSELYRKKLVAHAAHSARDAGATGLLLGLLG